jgi:NADH-quinone oxidoreductase subunit J
MAEVIAFYVLGGITVLASLAVIGQRNPMHSVLLLIVSFGGLAGLYVTLDSPFAAVTQIIVYAGAIMVLFVFVIMLLNAGSEERTNVSKLAGFAGVPLAIALTGLLAAAVARSEDAVQAATQSGVTAPTKALANLLFQDFVYPFELTSFLILVAILGAIVLAGPRSET